ncbi:hypothetical protein CRG98_042112 [Punica granatum]|uniref:Uncharacterized protein n=1 Tax=Punica granatum TaxID=22663 RepID=A0A2I0I0L8_PUNGR|nr:hypothetical protein CRG98_042112 [Punica granatum]
MTNNRATVTSNGVAVTRIDVAATSIDVTVTSNPAAVTGICVATTSNPAAVSYKNVMLTYISVVATSIGVVATSNLATDSRKELHPLDDFGRSKGKSPPRLVYEVPREDVNNVGVSCWFGGAPLYPRFVKERSRGGWCLP